MYTSFPVQEQFKHEISTIWWGFLLSKFTRFDCKTSQETKPNRISWKKVFHSEKSEPHTFRRTAQPQFFATNSPLRYAEKMRNSPVDAPSIPSRENYARFIRDTYHRLCGFGEGIKPGSDSALLNILTRICKRIFCETFSDHIKPRTHGQVFLDKSFSPMKTCPCVRSHLLTFRLSSLEKILRKIVHKKLPCTGLVHCGVAEGRNQSSDITIPFMPRPRDIARQSADGKARVSLSKFRSNLHSVWSTAESRLIILEFCPSLPCGLPMVFLRRVKLPG